MQKKIYKITPHSFVGVMTNSSSELFVCNAGKSVEQVKAIVSAVMELGGSKSPMTYAVVTEDLVIDPEAMEICKAFYDDYVEIELAKCESVGIEWYGTREIDCSLGWHNNEFKKYAKGILEELGVNPELWEVACGLLTIKKGDILIETYMNNLDTREEQALKELIGMQSIGSYNDLGVKAKEVYYYNGTENPTTR